MKINANEAVARAMFEAYEARLAPAFRHQWDNILSQRREEYRDRARAAIAAFLDAVREPSDVMKRVPLNLPLDGSCVDIWPMTVDALRAELLPPPVEKIGDV